jgi:hypothetical protein
MRINGVRNLIVGRILRDSQSDFIQSLRFRTGKQHHAVIRYGWQIWLANIIPLASRAKLLHYL